MTVTALVSGGKDSIYAAYLADTQGRTVDELVTLRPSDPDSMLYHTPNLGLVPLQAEAWGKAHREVSFTGTDEADELEALRRALERSHGWVVAGAIESSYQWARLLEVAGSLDRPVYTPLWRKEATRVVRAEIDAGLEIRLVHVAAEPLGPELLGQRLDEPLLAQLAAASATVRRTHLAGEGGEYETVVLDAPFFSSRIVIDEAERTESPSSATWRIQRAHLERRISPHGGARGS